MTWKMFLDDVREVTGIYPNAAPDEYVVCRSVFDAFAEIQMRGMPYFISFDHDLGIIPGTTIVSETGFDFAKSLVAQDLDETINIPKHFSFKVHSANPIGSNNITCLLTSYLNYRNNNELS